MRDPLRKRSACGRATRPVGLLSGYGITGDWGGIREDANVGRERFVPRPATELAESDQTDRSSQ